MMVALARSGVRLMPSMPSTMAPATTKTKKRQTFATTPDIVATRAAARVEPERLAVWLATRSRTRRMTLAPYRAAMSATTRTNEDGEWADDQVGDGRRGVGADAELGQQVIEPTPALVDLIRRHQCPPGHAPAPGRERSRPVFCPRFPDMTTLARTHVAARRSVPPFDFILRDRDAAGVRGRGGDGLHRHPGPVVGPGRGPQDLPEEAGPLRRARGHHDGGGRRVRLPAARTAGDGPVLADRARAHRRVRRGEQRAGRGTLVQPRPAPAAAL